MNILRALATTCGCPNCQQILAMLDAPYGDDAENAAIDDYRRLSPWREAVSAAAARDDAMARVEAACGRFDTVLDPH